MNRKQYNFNHGWKFREGSNEGQNFDRFCGEKYDTPQWCKAGNNGLAISNYNDNDWENVKLPHDFLIEKCNFTPEESENVGSLKKSFGWYRKTFQLPDFCKDKRIFVRFDGVYRDSQVWCNGHFLGRHLSGYMGFTYELTGLVNLDGNNTIAVKVDATEYEGWWYEGAGIYRDVCIIATPSLSIVNDSVFAKPYNIDIENKSCDIDVEFEVDTNKITSTDFSYKIDICDNKNTIVATADGINCVESFESKLIKEKVSIGNISLWDLSNPNMYIAKVTVTSNGETDEFSQKFAIRKLTYSHNDGMKLNDEPIFMKGSCGHDDFAGVGTALNKSVLQYKIKCLQNMGCNAYRCSHNPPSPLFLDACDEMGMLVIDETRLPGTSDEVLNDYKAMIKRDRNHPCVVFFSMGNEEMGIQKSPVGVYILERMQALGKKLDDSRDYLLAINCDKARITHYLEKNGLHLPVHGVNYLSNFEKKEYCHDYEYVDKNMPDCCFVSTETTGICTIRGYMTDEPIENLKMSDSGKRAFEWTNKEHQGVVNCYGDCKPTWGLTPELSFKEHSNKSFMLGEFLWTGFDYRGEVSPYLFPSVITSFGIIDLCGFFKDWAYYVKAWWGNEPLLHIFPSWNLNVAEGTPIAVWAFANCEEVELFLNGKSQGRKTLEKLGHLEWTVNYEQGEVKAIGYTNGEKVIEDTICTSGKEYKLLLKTEKPTIKANCDDSTIITVEVVDKDGNYVTDSTIDVDFEIEGVGTIKGVGNGNPRSLEHDKLPKRKLFAGKAMAIVEGTFDKGEIKFTAKSNGIESAEITINSIEADKENYIFSSNDVATGKFRVKEIDF